jgi:Skp family chaperone for outer membrane proteins
MKMIEIQASIEEGQRKIEHERMKLAAEIAADREAAAREVQKLADEHSFRMRELQGSLMVEAAKQSATAKQEEKNEKKKRESETAMAVQTSQQEFIKSIQPLIESISGKKTISMTLPDGRKASAEVSPQ